LSLGLHIHDLLRLIVCDAFLADEVPVLIVVVSA
jgi:hypothetical protein